MICVYYLSYPRHAFLPCLTLILLMNPFVPMVSSLINPNPITVQLRIFSLVKSLGVPPIFIYFFIFGNFLSI